LTTDVVVELFIYLVRDSCIIYRGRFFVCHGDGMLQCRET
jgi:hypothetical protein